METELNKTNSDRTEQNEGAVARRKFELTDLGSVRTETQGGAGGTTDAPHPSHE